MSFTRAANSLRPSITRLRLSLESMLGECERAHGPDDADRIPFPRRRVPTGRAGRAGADILGAILRGSPFGEFAGNAAGQQGNERFGE